MEKATSYYTPALLSVCNDIQIVGILNQLFIRDS